MKQLQRRVSIPVDEPVWNDVFTVAPLVLVGTREGGGGLRSRAEAHGHAARLGQLLLLRLHPRHATQDTLERTGEFTVSYPRPSQIIQTGLAAGARAEDGSKPGLHALSTFAASAVDGVLVEGAYLWLECALDRVLDGFGDNSLIIGRVVAASVDEAALREPDASENDDPVAEAPLLAYLSPGRFAAITASAVVPVPRRLQHLRREGLRSRVSSPARVSSMV